MSSARHVVTICAGTLTTAPLHTLLAERWGSTARMSIARILRGMKLTTKKPLMRGPLEREWGNLRIQYYPKGFFHRPQLSVCKPAHKCPEQLFIHSKPSALPRLYTMTYDRIYCLVKLVDLLHCVTRSLFSVHGGTW